MYLPLRNTLESIILLGSCLFVPAIHSGPSQYTAMPLPATSSIRQVVSRFVPNSLSMVYTGEVDNAPADTPIDPRWLVTHSISGTSVVAPGSACLRRSPYHHYRRPASVGALLLIRSGSS